MADSVKVRVAKVVFISYRTRSGVTVMVQRDDSLQQAVR